MDELNLKWSDLENAVKARNLDLTGKRYWALWAICNPDRVQLKKLKDAYNKSLYEHELSPEQIIIKVDEINALIDKIGLKTHMSLPKKAE